MSKCKYLMNGAYCLIYQEPCLESPCPKEMEEENQTNADIIRSMEDEELATLLQHLCCKPYLENCPQVEDCRDCWLDFLKAEMEEHT